jgi:hypothetical protein
MNLCTMLAQNSAATAADLLRGGEIYFTANRPSH